MFANSTNLISTLILFFLLFLVIGFVTNDISFIFIGMIVFIVTWLIFNQIHEHYTQNDPKLKEIKDTFNTFFQSNIVWKSPLDILNTKNIMEDIHFYRGEKSYTINKEKVYVCLKDDNNQYYNDNTLYYVIGHELSHVICDEIGHTEKFHRIFEALLLKMEEQGIYDPKIPITKDYCKNGDSEI
jgi:hypothetical protein